jgi:type 1 glutamine amidotransferase
MLHIVLFLATLLPVSAAPIRVQITAGGHPHESSFDGIFADYGDLAVTVNPHPSAFSRPLTKFVDVLVLYDLDDFTDPKEQQNLRTFLERGGGLVILHQALADNWRWKWWYEEVVGGRYLMGQDGDMPPSKSKEPVTLDVRPVAAHPVLEGVASLKLNDEAYKGMWHSPKSIVLMETDNPDSDKPVVWIGPWQKSRVVAIQLGSAPGTHKDPGYRRLVHNAIVWVAEKRR